MYVNPSGNAFLTKADHTCGAGLKIDLNSFVLLCRILSNNNISNIEDGAFDGLENLFEM